MAKLTPGDIVRNTHDTLGVVMRNDHDGLLVAYPGHDELTIEHPSSVQLLANLNSFLTSEENKTNN